MTGARARRPQGTTAAFDPSRCDREPVTTPGAIQPHGAMLAFLAEPPQRISHASANLAEVLGQPAQAVLGRALAEIVGVPASDILRETPAQTTSARKNCHRLPAPDGGSLEFQAWRTGRHFCVDIERVRDWDTDRPPMMLAQTVLERLKQATDCNELCEIVVHEMKAASGYDRVFVLRFAADGHSEVIAEACEAHLDPYLKRHYPASDVPQQAKQLYLRQRVGSVADYRYQPVSLLAHPALDDGTQVDMSGSMLRSVTSTHREFMRNMGTAASLSISITDGAALWGMVLCQHTTPRIAGPELRSIADVVGVVMSMLVGPLQAGEALKQQLVDRGILHTLTTRLGASLPLPEALASAQPELLGLVGASGAVVRLAGARHNFGRTPSPEVAEGIIATLQKQANGEVFASGNIAVPDGAFAAHARVASGALLMPLDDENGDALIWFRPEEVKTILWGGNPAAPATVAAADGRVIPRTSFAPWKETLRGRCRPWTAHDLALANELRRLVAEKLMRLMKLDLDVQKQRRVQQEAELAAAADALRVSDAHLSSVEMRLERAQASAGIGSWECEVASGKYLWSAELFKIHGTSPADLAPSFANTFPFMHHEDHRTRQNWFDDLKAGRKPDSFEARIIRPDGTERLVRIDGGIVIDANGAVTHVAGTVQDITERRQLELRLAQARKMEEIGGLTGGMAHDFNNMLGVVIVNLELLQRLVENDNAAEELCAEALDGASRCADLIRSLLAFARRQPLHPVRSDINIFVRDRVRQFERILGNDIKMELDLSTELLVTTVDQVQLESAMVNLAINARDAMPQGGRLNITTRNTRLDALYAAQHPGVDAGDYIVIEISDTGIGITSENISRVFDPFFTTKPAGAGTGLGLSMAFGFIKQSGGNLSVYSEEGCGTTFRIHLPRGGDASPDTTPPPEIVRATCGDETVLVVEDNAQLRLAVSRQLTYLGYHVRDCENADSAIGILSGTDRVDLLFTDLMMPGSINGLDLARQANHLRPNLPILLTSGFPGWRKEILNPGGQIPWPVLTKPYTRDQLARTLRELLS